MRIDRIPPGAPATAKRLAPGLGGFTELLGQAAMPAAEAAQEAALAVMLPEEAAGGDAAADRQARRHGRAMLQALGALQLGMLRGGEAAARAELAGLAAQAPVAHDPVLRLILREIALRAAVELARAPL